MAASKSDLSIIFQELYASVKDFNFASSTAFTFLLSLLL